MLRPQRSRHHHQPVSQSNNKESLVTFSIKSWYSPSGSYIQIQQPSINSGCDETFLLPVRYTTHMGKGKVFHFQVCIYFQFLTSFFIFSVHVHENLSTSISCLATI